MAIVNLIRVEGDTGELLEGYDSVNEYLNAHTSGAPSDFGLISHTCASTQRGLLIIEVWESAEAAGSFYRSEVFTAALSQAGFRPLSPDQVETHEVHNTFTGAGPE